MYDSCSGCAVRFAKGHPVLTRSTWLVYSAALIGSMLIPGDSVPNLGFFGWDKVAHLAVFAVLGVLTGAAFVGRSRMALTVLLYGTFLGGVTEAIQTFAPGRIPSIFDVAANFAGTILGLVLVQVLVARRSP